MTYVRLVKITQSIKGLFHDHGCLCLTQVLLLCYVIEELSTLADSIALHSKSSFSYSVTKKQILSVSHVS